MGGHPGDFRKALELVRAGLKAARASWGGRCWIEIQEPQEMTGPYIAIRHWSGGEMPWAASSSDLLALDWEEDDGSE